MTPAMLLAAAHGSVSAAQDVSIGHVLLQMALALGVIVGGIWGVGKITRRRPGKGRAAMRGRGAADGLTVLSRQMIGKGKSIAVVQAGEQCFLVGISDAGLTPLGELTQRGDATSPAQGEPAGPAAPGGAGPLTLAPLAPLDLAALDLSALTGAAGSTRAGSGADGATRGVAGGGRPDGGMPSMRSWLDNLREATIRR